MVTYADSLTSLKRDYLTSLSLEKRNFLNVHNIEEYNSSLKDLEDLFKESVDDFVLFDTSSSSLNDVAVEIASKIMSAIRKKYIRSFNDKYNLK